MKDPFWNAAAAAGLVLLLTPLVRAIARRAGFLDRPGPRKIHTDPVPYGGGIAVAAAVLALALPFSLPLTLGSLAMLTLGLVDDRFKLTPKIKLLVQVLVAAGMVWSGLRLELFDAAPGVGALVTVLWIVGVTNAFNLLDHMDGLTSGVAALAGGAFLAIAIQTGQAPVALLLGPLVGACLAFLVFNFAPAEIFLGDAGSLFIGFWLACLTVRFTFYDSHYPLYTYLVPLAVLAVPLYDTGGVLLIRLIQRRPLFQGDTSHLAHRLVALGLTRRQAVLTIYALTLFTGLSAALLYHVRKTEALLVLGQILLTFALIAVLEIAGRRRAG